LVISRQSCEALLWASNATIVIQLTGHWSSVIENFISVDNTKAALEVASACFRKCSTGHPARATDIHTQPSRHNPFLSQLGSQDSGQDPPARNTNMKICLPADLQQMIMPV
jgi:hypothetical protein